MPSRAKKKNIVCRCTCPCVKCRRSSTRGKKTEDDSDTVPSDDSDTSLEIGRKRPKKKVELIDVLDSSEHDSDSTLIISRRKSAKKRRKAKGGNSRKPAKRTKTKKKSSSEVDDDSCSSGDVSMKDSDRSDSESSRPNKRTKRRGHHKTKTKHKKNDFINDEVSSSGDDEAEDDGASSESTKKNKRTKRKVHAKSKSKHQKNGFIDDEVSASDDDRSEDQASDYGPTRKTKQSKKRSSRKNTSRNNRKGRKKETSTGDDSEEDKGGSENGQDSDASDKEDDRSVVEARNGEPRRRSLRIKRKMKERTPWPDMRKRARSRSRSSSSNNSSSSNSSSTKGNIEFSSDSEDDDESDKSCSSTEESEPEDLSKRVCLVCKNLGKREIVGRSQSDETEWCECDECQVTSNMRDYDRVCCKELLDVVKFRKNEIYGPCITNHHRFELEVLQFRALERSGFRRTDFYGNTDSYNAQWSFRRWIWDRLSSQDRIMIPACVRARIVKQFPRKGTELFRSTGDARCCKKIHCRKC